MKGMKVNIKRLLKDNCCDKLISVIVPVYNVGIYIDKCIESILCQSYTNFELILVDDGTPDNSAEKCDEYAEKDDRIIVIHKSNGGLSSARNAGMDIASGEFVTFIDSDDYVNEHYLKIMMQLQELTQADIVQTNIKTTKSNCDDITISKNTILYKVVDAHKAINSFCLKPSASAKLYAKSVADNVRFLSWRIHEDDATYYHFAYRAKSICFSDIPLYYYFQSENSIMRNGKKDFPLDFIPIYEERIDYFKKRGEKQLTEGSYFRFCIVLMLDYMSFVKNGTNRNDLTRILRLFRDNYKYCNFSAIPLLYRCMLFVFHIAPTAITRLVLLLHLR